VEGKGLIVVELYPVDAPITVRQMLRLTDERFFDNLLFHRVVPNWVIQSGDPDSRTWTPEQARAKPDGRGGTVGLGESVSGKSIPFERNNVFHYKGTIGMALEAPMTDTGDSQWFINLADNLRLNGRYVAFGRVIQGLEVVDKVRRGDRIRSIRRVILEPSWF
jgi:cyclophilin family peptidyl-prolyl cis-trans isomerase